MEEENRGLGWRKQVGEESVGGDSAGVRALSCLWCVDGPDPSWLLEKLSLEAAISGKEKALLSFPVAGV